MKRSDLQQIIANLIETGIKEGIFATDSTDYETWAVSQSLSEEILICIESHGMQPPGGPFRVRNKRWNPEKEEWYEIEECAMVNQWEPEVTEAEPDVTKIKDK